MARLGQPSIAGLASYAPIFSRLSSGAHLLSFFRRVILAIWEVVLGHIMEHVGDGAAGRYGVYRDFLVAAVFCEDSDERVDSSLGP